MNTGGFLGEDPAAPEPEEYQAESDNRLVMYWPEITWNNHLTWHEIELEPSE